MSDVFDVAVECLLALRKLTQPQRRRVLQVLSAVLDLTEAHRGPAPADAGKE